MAQTATGADLYTVVKNISGSAKHFGFLGAHGRDLAANATFSHPGNLMAQLADNPRKLAGLITSLTDGDLEIVSSPAHYLRDMVWGETQKVALSAGNLGTVDPTYDETGSTTFDDA